MDPPPVLYVTTSDGYNIAYCESGEGPPFVFMPTISSHIHLAWAPGNYLHPWLVRLSARFRLVQYDSRGQGMSSRNVVSYSLADLERDLEAVVDRLGLDRFILMGSNFAGHAAVRFAAEHPGRVEALILACCSVSGRSWPMINALDLARNWELFPGVLVPAMRAPTLELRQLEIDHFRQSVTQQDWLLMAPVWAASEVADVLPHLKTPTLVLHPRDYQNMPPERSIESASLIPDARLVLLEGVLELCDAADGIRAIESFLGSLPAEPSPPRVISEAAAHGLSQRELEVLHLLTAGKSNQQIADALVISVNTVNRHVSNIYTKTGSANRTEAANYAHRHHLV